MSKDRCLYRPSSQRFAPLALAIAVSLAGTAHAANIVVNSANTDSEAAPVCTIVDAVSAINTQLAVGGCAAGDGVNDTIDLTGFSTPTTIVFASANNLGHALNLSNPAIIKGTLLSGSPAVTITRSTVTGTPNFGLIDTIKPLTIDSIAVTNGSSGIYSGGGVLSGDDLTVLNSVFTGNSTNSAGGAISTSGKLSITNSIVSGNSAGAIGGGVQSYKTMTMYTSYIHDNTALGTGTGNYGGGGLFCQSNILMVSTTVAKNTSAAMGGGITSQAAVTLTSSTVDSNTSAGEGGGIYSTSGIVTLTGTTISNNKSTASSGGGIFGVNLDITNSTITGNSASAAGGGIDATATIGATYATMADNTSGSSGGGGVFGSGADLQGTIVYGNSPDDLTSTSAGTLTGAYNDIHSLTGATDQTQNDIDCNPNLAALADNGGPTLTMALPSGSCAVDAAGSPPTVATDQRGFSRPAQPNTNADIGAYEANSSNPDIIFQNGFES